MVAGAQNVASGEFRVDPFLAPDAAWQRLAAHSPAATLYHDDRWRELLGRAYGLKFSLAGLHNRERLLAGCLLARSPKPFTNRLIALPFSDYAPPLAADSTAQH